MGFITYVGRTPQADDVWIACDYCGGAGADMSRDNEPTDRGHLHGDNRDMAFRGYVPTNVCQVCHGQGGSWIPKAKEKIRLNIAYARAEDRDNQRNWTTGSLQTWKPDEGRWHPPIDSEPSWKRFWKWESDTNPDDCEEEAK